MEHVHTVRPQTHICACPEVARQHVRAIPALGPPATAPMPPDLMIHEHSLGRPGKFNGWADFADDPVEGMTVRPNRLAGEAVRHGTGCRRSHERNAFG